MVYAQPTANVSPVSNDALVYLLVHAGSSLAHLRERAAKVMTVDGPLVLGFCPRQMKTLCDILDEGQARIQRRLAGLVGPGAALEATEDSDIRGKSEDPISFMAEYRACCRRLCKGLNESLRISDAPSGAMLSELVLRLEKQLWLMDSPKHDPGSDRYRSVSIFLTC
jgi:hypothetical protein